MGLKVGMLVIILLGLILFFDVRFFFYFFLDLGINIKIKILGENIIVILLMLQKFQSLVLMEQIGFCDRVIKSL